MPLIEIKSGPTVPPRAYEPTEAQLIMLRTLMHAPRYLIVREKAWKPVESILPIFTRASLEHFLWDIDNRGGHAQVVSYRPDSEDLGPLEPNPWPFRIAFAILLALVAVAIWLASRL